MHENGKDDPLIRTLLIIILGTIAFSLLFQLFKGGNNMDMGMGNMGNTGYSMDGLLGGLLGLLFNLLIMALVVGAIIAIVQWVRKSFFKDANPKTMQLFSDPLLKTVAVVVGAVFGLILLFGVFGNFFNTGMGYGMNGFSSSLSLYGLLTLLIKIMAIVLVVSVILALVAYLKKQYEAGAFNAFRNNGTGTDTGNNNSNTGTGTGGNPGTGSQA